MRKRTGTFLPWLVVMVVTTNFFLYSCIPLVLPDDVVPAGSGDVEPGGGGDARRIATWYAKDARGPCIFCRAVLEYNDAGQLLSETKRSYNCISNAVHSTETHRFEYDDAGRIVTKIRVYETGNDRIESRVGYTYDEFNRVSQESSTPPMSYTSIDSDYTYDDEGQLQSIGSGSNARTFNWRAGRLTGYTLGGSLTYSYSYSESGTCTRYVVTPSPMVRSDFFYDDAGLLTRRTFHDEVGPAYHQHFTYERGRSSFDYSSVEMSLTYSFGLFRTIGLP